ncbi:universal stress protein [filamentous cyanobacterium CCP5]|nr:universal stress protein [filamentous cyanobacterium CCP5]
MIEKILVAIEPGDACHHVFHQAAELAQKIQASLNLLSILSPKEDGSLTLAPYSDRDWTTYRETYGKLETANIRLLQSLTDKAKEMGIKAEFTQESGSPGPTICQFAKIWGADLIIVGSRGRKGMSEMLLGSVSNYVVHHATCSVMVVHQQD